MLKTIWSIFVFIFFLSFLIYLDLRPKVKNIEIVQIPHVFTEIPQETPSFDNELINHINSVNSKIKSIYYPKIIIRSGKIKLQSVFLYEKNKKFRMKNWSFLGLEADIGSNPDVFWFWSKRMEPSALFYSSHENLSKTRLKTPFHPEWMMETIGINEIETKDLLVFDYKNYTCAAQSRMDSISGKPLTRIYLIDKDKKTFYGHYLFDRNQNLIVSFEVYDYYCINGIYFPKEIGINWNQESVKLNWQLEKPIINYKFNESNWVIPNMQPKIDLNGY